MAVLRNTATDDNSINYIATLAFFCCVTSIIAMLKFWRFKTSFNVYGEKKQKSRKGQDDVGNIMSLNGAYRTNRDEFSVYNNDNSEPQRKLTPSIQPPPPIPFNSKSDSLRPSKSTSDLIKNKNLPPSQREIQSGISQDPRGAEHEYNHRNKDSKNHKPLDAEKRVEKQKFEEQKKLEKQKLEEKKKLEKQRIEEEKKRERLAMQERAKQEKMVKEREKEQMKNNKKLKKTAPQRPLANPLAQSNNTTINNAPKPSTSQQYSNNTLESSISKTSGPPPYSERTENGNDSNVSFSKPEDPGSWDMISQHRHNLGNKRPLKPDEPLKGQATTLDLHFGLGEQMNKGNSEV